MGDSMTPQTPQRAAPTVRTGPGTRRRGARTLGVAGLLLLVFFSAGCRRQWEIVRENEREYAVSTARAHAKRGDCAKAMPSIDRASARLDLGPFSKEAIQMRIRCYEKVGRVDAARAHKRLLEDFYPKQNPAYPKADGSSIFRVSSIPDVLFENPPSVFELQEPVFPEFARRSDITGRVVIAFQLSSADRPRNIRVLEMPHPLLATWAIEAVERSSKKRGTEKAVIAPGGHYIATYNFRYRFSKNAEDRILTPNDPSATEPKTSP